MRIINRDPYFHSYQRTCSETSSTLEKQWSRLSYDLYNSASCPFQNNIKTIRVEPAKNLLKIFTKAENRYTVRYEELKIFDLENVTGLEDTFYQEVIHYRVLDWFDVKTTGGHIEFEVLEDKDSLFVNRVIFFDSTRVDGSRIHKDLLAESFLTSDQLNDVEFTDTMVRFKILNLLEQTGFKRPQLELWKRDIYPVKKTLLKIEGNITLMGDE